MSAALEDVDPREAVDMWLDRQRSEKAEETVQSYGYRLGHFVEWCEDEGIDSLNDLDASDLLQYDSERRGQDLSTNTLRNQLGTLQQFLDFAERFDMVSEGMAERLELPKLTKGDRVNEEKLTADRAEAIRENLRRYRRAGRDHALFVVAWHTAARLGGLRSLDVENCYLADDDLERLRHRDDVDEDVLEDVETPFLFFRTDAETDTPLKNQRSGERPVAIAEDVADVLREYLRVGRPAVRDEHDRRPLFPTESGGRISKSGIRARMNVITQPCRFGVECPHGREPETCEARKHGYESRCPSSRSPHRIRTGSITDHLDRGWPIEALSERVDATPEVIRDHYDQPELLRRMQNRRNYLDGATEA